LEDRVNKTIAEPMSPDAVLQAITAARVVPVLRSSTSAAAVEEGNTFVSGGLPVVEVTFSIPDTTSVIRELAATPGAIVGAGTVLTRQQAVDAVEAGAHFLVSPVLTDWLLPLAAELGVLAVPGAASPTELFTAVESGARMVKVFPIARLGGPAYIRDLLAPMPHLPLMATGGVTAPLAEALLAAGCAAVGMGSILVDDTIGETPGDRVEAVARLLGSRRP
jgi:2-dehydro-3-deoxyphosphogluconate aldolase/(4S)-4-hydroxy-2-oxoglutarate aldolase